MSGAELGDSMEWEGGMASGVPAESSGIAAHPKAQLPEGFQPLFRMVGEWPRVKGAVLCGSGWAGSHWRCTEPTVLSLLVAPAQESPLEQGKHTVMLCQNIRQCCSSSCSRMKSSCGVTHVFQEKQTAPITFVFS